MRRLSIAMLAVLGLMLVTCVTPALAQSITGLSLRPADAAPEGSARGAADIMQSDGGFKVSVDLSSNADLLKISRFEGATAFVVWAVDMEGVAHRIGTLDDDLALADAPVDFVVARLIVTAEPSADAATMEGAPLFQAILRNVEVKSSEGGAMAPAAEATATTPEAEATATSAPAPTAGETTKPTVLPTTGSVAQDLAVLAALAAVLLLLGLRFRTVRL
jgi:hypothetical protein